LEIGVIGTGYVGLVAGACFAETGNTVICVDLNEAKVAALQRGEIPIYEPGLEEMIRRNTAAGRIRFTTSTAEAVGQSHVIFIAVGTPQGEDGSADLTYVLAAARQIGLAMNGPKIVVDKSTVPVGTAERVAQTIREVTSHPVSVVSNPEFLKEGNAIEDFLKPDRVVIGADHDLAGHALLTVARVHRQGNPRSGYRGATTTGSRTCSLGGPSIACCRRCRIGNGC